VTTLPHLLPDRKNKTPGLLLKGAVKSGHDSGFVYLGEGERQDTNGVQTSMKDQERTEGGEVRDTNSLPLFPSILENLLLR
jgi:hypothetical protein